MKKTQRDLLKLEMEYDIKNDVWAVVEKQGASYEWVAIVPTEEKKNLRAFSLVLAKKE